MSGLSYVKQPVKASSSVTPKVSGVTYQNLTGRPLLIIYTFEAFKSAANEDAYVRIKTNSSSPPVEIVSEGGFVGMIADVSPIIGRFMVIALITNEWYYLAEDILQGGSTITKRTWIEVEL